MVVLYLREVMQHTGVKRTRNRCTQGMSVMLRVYKQCVHHIVKNTCLANGCDKGNCEGKILYKKMVLCALNFAFCPVEKHKGKIRVKSKFKQSVICILSGLSLEYYFVQYER